MFGCFILRLGLLLLFFINCIACMYVCIYLFTRHGYTKVYSDNENNCEFG